MVLKFPSNELQRLNALLNFKILDTEEEEVYNIIAEMAAAIMETPVALITFLDQDRTWSKAKVGTSVSERSRELTFCAHTILSSDPMIIEDASLDERFSDNPFVVGDPKIRFYFGVPLLTNNNEAIGAICTVDSVVRQKPSQFQLDAIKSLSKLIMHQLELRKFIVNFNDDFKKIKDFSLIGKDDENIISVYEDLNDKCDKILKRIKARKSIQIL